MQYTIHVGGKPITLEHGDLDSTIDVDGLTAIDTSNLFGEAVTISAAVNRIGLLKSEVAANLSEIKLRNKLFEGNFRNKLRKEASENAGHYTLRVDNEDVRIKLTETGLATSFETDPEWIKFQKEYIQAEKDFNALDSLYWACQDKSKKLNGFIGSTTPEEFLEGIIEGKVNGIFIKKKKGLSK